MIREKILNVLSFPKVKTLTARLTTIWLIFSSILYGTIAILDSNIYLWQEFYLTFSILSCITGFTFFLEYFLRVWVYHQNCSNENSKSKQWEYLKSFVGIIDFISAISFLLYLIGHFIYELMEVARILRLFVLFKLFRYSGSFKIILSVIRRKKEELLITLMLCLILMFFGTIFIYIAEHEAQPSVFTNLFSSMWFTAINLFTIGYGEIVPITPLGKVISGIISFAGITLFLLPASVIVSGFLDEIEERKPYSEICPNCNETIQNSAFIRELKKKYERKNNIKIDDMSSRKKKLFKLIQFNFPSKLGQKIVFFFFTSLITLNVLAIMVETNPSLSLELRFVLNSLLIFSIIVFTIEYILRVWCITAAKKEKYKDSIRGRIKYVFSPIAIMDIITLLALCLILVFNYVPIIVLYLQILRMLVIFKMGHFIDVFRVIKIIFKETKREFLATILLCWIFLVFSSTLIYYLERSAQPSKFPDILTSLWMGIITFTTTGFGDIYPITTGGRFCTIALAFLGVSLFILPAGILGSSFFSTMQEYRYYKICPKCDFIISRPKIKLRI